MRENENKQAVIPVEQEIDYGEINRKIGLNNITVSQKPMLTISAWCHNHIKVLHKKYPSTEWLAICKIENLWDWHFVMTDMIHPQQKWVGGEVETTDDWMDWAVDYLVKQGEDLSKWNCILHSHHSMGCFWSGTDDKARLSLNDWRTLAWAVVSSYKWNEIDYKGCLNFYKPYPIEIDCDIEYEVNDLYEQSVEWDEYIKNRKQEIYNEKIKTDSILAELQCDYNYDNLLSYLWIDITNELKENAKIITMKMPCPEYEERLKEIMKEAEEETQKEIWAPIDNELFGWVEWSDFLCQQLSEARDIPIKVEQISKPLDVNLNKASSWKEADKIYSQNAGIIDDCYYNNYDDSNWFNTYNYPTKSDLVEMLDLCPDFKFLPNADWLWLVYNYTISKWEYIGDCMDALYDYPDDYICL